VLEVSGETKPTIAGIIVDEVSEVVFITDEQIEPPPAFGSDAGAGFILGMGKVSEKVVMLLDVDSILCLGDLAGLENA